MAKETRFSRTSVQTPALTNGPREQTKLVPRAVPDFKSSRAGLDGLSRAFDNFFGAVGRAGETLMQAVEIGQRRQIEHENTAQQRQAAGDALAGRPMDDAQTEDYDYYDTYRTVLAQKNGAEAIREFQNWYQTDFLQKSPDGDLAQARQEWAIQNLTGSDDPEFEGMALASFYKGTETMLGTHMESRLKAQFAKGRENLEAVIDADAGSGSITPERIAFYTKAYATLDPLNAHEAAPAVASALSVAIQNHPGKAQPILNTLAMEGTGVNGKSFAQSFPAAYAALQQKAVQSFMATNTMAEWEAVNALKERSMKLKELNDDDLIQFGHDLIVTRNRYGAASDIESLRGVMAKEIDRRATEQTTFAHVQQMLMGRTPTDVDVLRKNLPTYMRKVMGIDNILTADPVTVGEILVRAGTVVSEDHRAQLSGAVMNFDNPAAQVSAVRLLTNIERMRDQKFAANFLTDEAYRYYRHISDEMFLTNEDPAATVARVAEIRRNTKPVDSWATIVGKPPGEARVDVDKRVDAAVKTTFSDAGFLGTGLFRSNVYIPGPIRERITSYAMAVVNERGAQGISWEKAVDEAVGRMAQRGQVLPQNGTYVLSFDENQNAAYRDQDMARPRVQMGLSVFNPTSGERVNTVKVYEEQLTALGRSVPQLFKSGSTSDVSLTEHPYAVAKGAFSVMQNGNYIAFEPGESFEVGGRKITFPKDDDGSLVTQLSELMPKGFGFVQIDVGFDKSAWMLTYRPNFGSDEGVSLKTREQEFQPPAAPRSTPRQVVFAPRTPSQLMNNEGN